MFFHGLQSDKSIGFLHDKIQDMDIRKKIKELLDQILAINYPSNTQIPFPALFL